MTTNTTKNVYLLMPPVGDAVYIAAQFGGDKITPYFEFIQNQTNLLNVTGLNQWKNQVASWQDAVKQLSQSDPLPSKPVSAKSRVVLCMSVDASGNIITAADTTSIVAGAYIATDDGPGFDVQFPCMTPNRGGTLAPAGGGSIVSPLPVGQLTDTQMLTALYNHMIARDAMNASNRSK